MLNQLKILLHKYHQHNDDGISSQMREYIENCGYPRNHQFFICNKKLLPTRKLITRVRKISALYPDVLESFLDLSCCRGFFIFSANQVASCQRSLGIDVNPINIEACQVLKNYLKLDKPKFELLTLDKLAGQIQDFGGAYQTVLLANTYQYLFFGSDGWPGYLSHEKIFAYLSQICANRLIFSNRAELEHCQNKAQIKEAGIIAQQYNSHAIITAAEKYFNVIPRGNIGHYPLWVLERR